MSRDGDFAGGFRDQGLRGTFVDGFLHSAALPCGNSSMGGDVVAVRTRIVAMNMRQGREARWHG